MTCEDSREESGQLGDIVGGERPTGESPREPEHSLTDDQRENSQSRRWYRDPAIVVNITALVVTIAINCWGFLEREHERQGARDQQSQEIIEQVVSDLIKTENELLTA